MIAVLDYRDGFKQTAPGAQSPTESTKSESGRPAQCYESGEEKRHMTTLYELEQAFRPGSLFRRDFLGHGELAASWELDRNRCAEPSCWV